MSDRRLYESTFIINATLEDNDVEAIITRVSEYLAEQEAQITEMNKWGRRRLAYPVKKKYNGYYVYMTFEAVPTTIPLLERFFVLEDNALRHLTLQLDIKLKEFRKVRAEAQAIRAAALAAEAKAMGYRESPREGGRDSREGGRDMRDGGRDSRDGGREPREPREPREALREPSQN
jgi:small subunit ribosomal protein S6